MMRYRQSSVHDCVAGLPGHAGLVNRPMTRRVRMLKGPLVAGAAGCELPRTKTTATLQEGRQG
jgi:hypothetical protein